MSTKNKKIVYYLAAFLVVLMLVCTCLLGNTFARYVTGTSGDATTNIANWYVSATGVFDSNTTYTFDESTNGLSPNKNLTGATSGVNNSTSVVNIATITLNAEVDVALTISAGDLTYYDNELSPSEITGTTTYDASTYTSISKTDLDRVFSLNVYCTTAVPDGSGTSGAILPADVTGHSSATKVADTYEGGSTTLYWASTGSSLATKINTTAGNATTVYVYAWITWTTLYESAYYDGTVGGVDLADLLDTQIGRTLGYITTDLSATAVQYSQSPSDS